MLMQRAATLQYVHPTKQVHLCLQLPPVHTAAAAAEEEEEAFTTSASQQFHQFCA